MRWRIAKASVIGTGHIKANMPCQDYCAVKMSGNTLILAVSDGLGSAALAECGSEWACCSVVDAIHKHLEAQGSSLTQTIRRIMNPTPSLDMEHVLHDAFTHARNELQRHADAKQAALRDYACTLLVAVITETDWHTLHIGDGAIVGICEDGSIQTLSSPHSGEFINDTIPLTSNDYAKHLRYAHKSEKLQGIALLSDGVQPMSINYQTGAPFSGFFQPMMDWLVHLDDIEKADISISEMLNSDKFRQKSDDDMTLVLAHLNTR